MKNYKIGPSFVGPEGLINKNMACINISSTASILANNTQIQQQPDMQLIKFPFIFQQQELNVWAPPSIILYTPSIFKFDFNVIKLLLVNCMVNILVAVLFKC